MTGHIALYLPRGMASHLTQAGNWVPPVMNIGNRHRYVEGLVCEWKVLRGSGHAPLRARRTLGTHDRGRLHRGDITLEGLARAGASLDVQHGPCVAERSPDLCRDPWLGAPGRGIRGADGVNQPSAGHNASFLAVTTLNVPQSPAMGATRSCRSRRRVGIPEILQWPMQLEWPPAVEKPGSLVRNQSVHKAGGLLWNLRSRRLAS